MKSKSGLLLFAWQNVGRVANNSTGRETIIKMCMIDCKRKQNI